MNRFRVIGEKELNWHLDLLLSALIAFTLLVGRQCFDAVGWAAGRASGL